MEYRFADHPAVLQVLDDNAFQQLGGDSGVPDAFRIDNENRASGAHAQAWRFTAFYPSRAKEKASTIEK